MGVKQYLIIFIASVCLSFIFENGFSRTKPEESNQHPFFNDSGPWVRWWWFARVLNEKDIAHQLDWIQSKGFGGVEIAWIYPVNRNPDADRTPFLSEEWSQKVAFAKDYCDKNGLGCDFTFGSLWPFGGTFVPDHERTMVYGDTTFRQKLRLSWEHPEIGNVINHLDSMALHHYSDIVGKSLAPALDGGTSALFCDSWEVHTKKIWTKDFGDTFEQTFGYHLSPYMDNIYEKQYADVHYDYIKLVSEYALNNFFRPFTSICHELGALSRVQCAGAPTDLLQAYAAVDIPETEAMLYEPHFSVIPASAAALTSKPVVSSETFTCLYGFPDDYFKQERAGDLKLVADALFANGTNQIIWHGMPYNPAGTDTIHFYATVHVGASGSLTSELKSFNTYLQKVSEYLKKGQTYSRTAVYLPLEDAWMGQEYPEKLQMKWSWGEYELRYVETPNEIKGYRPLWINNHFLKQCLMKNKQLCFGDNVFEFLYVDVDYLDYDALTTILTLAKKGLPVCLKSKPEEPGKLKHSDYQDKLKKLTSLDNVDSRYKKLKVGKPLIEGKKIPDFWVRENNDEMYFFFANPKTRDISFPLDYGEAYDSKVYTSQIKINHKNYQKKINLEFRPFQSLLYKMDSMGNISKIDISYEPSDK
jgi:hypothetical protein